MKVKRIILFFIFLCFNIIVADALLSVSDIIILPKTGHRKPPIYFNHRAHSEDYGTKCDQCHHKGTNEKCSNCHLRRDQHEIINIKGAFHQQCHDCHRKTSGPKACGRCHVKKK